MVIRIHVILENLSQHNHWFSSTEWLWTPFALEWVLLSISSDFLKQLYHFYIFRLLFPRHFIRIWFLCGKYNRLEGLRQIFKSISLSDRLLRSAYRIGLENINLKDLLRHWTSSKWYCYRRILVWFYWNWNLYCNESCWYQSRYFWIETDRK